VGRVADPFRLRLLNHERAFAFGIPAGFRIRTQLAVHNSRFSVPVRTSNNNFYILHMCTCLNLGLARPCKRIGQRHVLFGLPVSFGIVYDAVQ